VLPLAIDPGVEGRLRIRHLAVLVAVAEAKSMQTAAHRVNVTAGAVSKCVREAEAILGVTVFRRTARGVETTEAGEAVLGRVRVLLTDLRAATEDIAAMKDGAVGRVKVGTMAVVESDLLPKTILRVRGAAPRVFVQSVEGTRELVVEALQRGDIDCAVGRLNAAGPVAGLEQEALYRMPVAIVVGPHHPLARVRRMSWKRLCDFDWIMPPPASPVRQALDRQFASLQLCTPRVAVESTAFLVNRSLLAGSDMITVMPLSAAQSLEAMGGLALLPVKLDVELPMIGVITRAGDPPSATKLFLAALRQEAAELDIRIAAPRMAAAKRATSGSAPEPGPSNPQPHPEEQPKAVSRRA
jgi:DNA-binding transcriptional LysR family regulator